MMNVLTGWCVVEGHLKWDRGKEETNTQMFLSQLGQAFIVNVRGCDFYHLILLIKICLSPIQNGGKCLCHATNQWAVTIPYSLDCTLHIFNHVLLLTDDYSLQRLSVPIPSP